VFIAVGAMVIFQPELRRMLAELGNLPLFATTSEQRGPSRSSIQTCERLADVKIGALIAIEQSIQLQEAVESGIKVDCDATRKCWRPFSSQTNAVHDGGVILKGDRIAYAACIFPLTQAVGPEQVAGHAASRGDWPERGNGCGHRRGVRGNRMISYAYKGQLTRGVTLEELRAFLDHRGVAPRQNSRRGPMAARAVPGAQPDGRPPGHHQTRARPVPKKRGK